MSIGLNGSSLAENNVRFQSGGAAYIDHATVGQNITFRTSNSSALDTQAMFLKSDGRLQLYCLNNSRGLELNIGGNASSLVFDRNMHITSNIRASDGGSNVAGSSGGGSRITLNKSHVQFFTWAPTTNAGDAPTYVERLKIENSGTHVYGNADGVLNLDTTDSRGSFVRFKASGTTQAWVGIPQGFGSGGATDLGLRSSRHIYFQSGNTERWSLNTSGHLYVATHDSYDIGQNGQTCRNVFSTKFVHRTGTSSGTGINEAEAIYIGGGMHFFHDNVTLSTSNFTHGITNNRSYDCIRIRNSGSGSAIYAEQGTISSGSDYRMKENVEPITGAIDAVKKLKPCTYNIRKSFNEHDAGGTHQGFIAHEVQEAIPNIANIVKGTKDAMEEVRYMEEDENIPSGKKPGDGTGVFTDNPDYQGIDYGHMTPILCAALKEAITKIETLETKIAALESA